MENGLGNGIIGWGSLQVPLGHFKQFKIHQEVVESC